MKTKKVGEILRKARMEKLLTYEDVASQTKIHTKFLEALEEGDYESFSSSVHLKGFLTTYAEYLGLPSESVLAFFRREYKEEIRRNPLSRAVRPLNTPRLFLTPSSVLVSSVVLLVFLFLSYLFLEYRSFAGAPMLVIKSPVEDEVVIEIPTVSLAGTTDPDATVSINGQKIALGENGIFSTSITLTEGINVLNIVSTNKLGKSSTATKTVVVNSRHGGDKPTGKTQRLGIIQAELTIGPNAAWVEVSTDGIKKFDGLLGAGVSQTFEGLSQIRVFSGNAGSTRVSLNGGESLVLGQEGEVLERVYNNEESLTQQEATPSDIPVEIME